MAMKYCPSCRAELVNLPLDGVTRLCCADSCGYVFWNNPIPVVAAIIEYEGKVLLARNAAWPAGWFALITGFLERGETPEQCVLREVKEELDLEGEIVEFLGNYSFPEQNQLLVVFHVKATGVVTLNEELVEYQLLEHAEVKPWNMGTGPALRDWLERRG